MRQSVFRTLGLRLVFRFCLKQGSFRMKKVIKKKKSYDFVYISFWEPTPCKSVFKCEFYP